MLAMMMALEGVKMGNAFGDGAYDTIDVRQFIYDVGRKQIIPPKRAAKQQKKNPLPALKERDNAIQRMKDLGEEQNRNKRSGTIKSRLLKLICFGTKQFWETASPLGRE